MCHMEFNPRENHFYSDSNSHLSAPNKEKDDGFVDFIIILLVIVARTKSSSERKTACRRDLNQGGKGKAV